MFPKKLTTSRQKKKYLKDLLSFVEDAQPFLNDGIINKWQLKEEFEKGRKVKKIEMLYVVIQQIQRLSYPQDSAKYVNEFSAKNLEFDVWIDQVQLSLATLKMPKKKKGIVRTL